MQKKKFYSELAYVFGLIALAIGTALMEKANLGLSMVIAPAYIIHLKVSEFLPFFSFGMASYLFQGLLLIIMCIVLKKGKISYFLSFVTAVVYGFLLDGIIWIFSFVTVGETWLRILFFVLGLPIASMGVAMLFNTYLPPEAYDLFVKEISSTYNLNITKFKTIYDISSLVLSVILSFLFFGWMHFEGVKIGTLICSILNGVLIGAFSKLYNKAFIFEDKFNLRRYF